MATRPASRKPRRGALPVDRGERGVVWLHGQAVEYPIRRSGRRTIGLTIEADGSLLITAPTRVSRAEIEAVVLEKTRWILRHLGTVQARPVVPTLAYVSGDQLHFRGELLTLDIVDVRVRPEPAGQLSLFARPTQPAPPLTPGVSVNGGRIVVVPANSGQSGAAIRTQIEAWYWHEAQRVIPGRVRQYAALVGRPVERVRITDPQRQWGACTSKGTITMSWRLICAPPALLDYVAAHEACHLVHRHHRPTFWRLVEQLDPEFRAHRQELRERRDDFLLPELAPVPGTVE